MIQAVDGDTLLSHDLHLLESVEFKQRIKHIVEIIEEVKWENMDPDMLTRFVCCHLHYCCFSFLPNLFLLYKLHFQAHLKTVSGLMFAANLLVMLSWLFHLPWLLGIGTLKVLALKF